MVTMLLKHLWKTKLYFNVIKLVLFIEIYLECLMRLLNRQIIKNKIKKINKLKNAIITVHLRNVLET